MSTAKGFVRVGLVLASISSTLSYGKSVTVDMINQKPSDYMGKQVTLSGQVDRIFGPGAYLFADKGNLTDPNHRILVIDNRNQPSNKGSQQQPGVSGQTLKEGEELNLKGKVEQLNYSSESVSVSPKKNQEVVQDSSMSLPVVIVQSMTTGSR